MKTIRIILLWWTVLLTLLLWIVKSGILRRSDNDFLQFLNKVFIGNQIIVTTTSDLALEKVKITLADSKETIFENMIFKDTIWEVYGGPIFDIYYEDMLLGRAFHDNTNDWYVNEFIFHVFKVNNKIRFNFTTHGKDKHGDEGYTRIEENAKTSQFFHSL